MNIFVSRDKMIGDQFEKGLKDLGAHFGKLRRTSDRALLLLRAMRSAIWMAVATRLMRRQDTLALINSRRSNRHD